jgi:hypothetical protein
MTFSTQTLPFIFYKEMFVRTCSSHLPTVYHTLGNLIFLQLSAQHADM